jgi:hypothetical protein
MRVESNTQVLWQESTMTVSMAPPWPNVLDLNPEGPGRGLGISLQFRDGGRSAARSIVRVSLTGR